MKTQPQVVTARQVVEDAKIVGRSFKDGSYGPARAMPYFYSGLRNLRNRLSSAWGVFTGKYDALDWEDDK